MTTRVSFIGAGKVGCSLARYLAADPARGQKDVELAGFFSASAESARAAADFAGGRAFASAEEATREAELVFVTTPDGRIAEIAAQLAAAGRRQRPRPCRKGLCPLLGSPCVRRALSPARARRRGLLRPPPLRREQPLRLLAGALSGMVHPRGRRRGNLAPARSSRRAGQPRGAHPRRPEDPLPRRRRHGLKPGCRPLRHGSLRAYHLRICPRGRRGGPGRALSGKRPPHSRGRRGGLAHRTGRPWRPGNDRRPSELSFWR